MAVTLDWAGFERVLVDALVRAVRSTVADRPGERFYAAVLDGIYRETDGRITLPTFGMNSVEALARVAVEEQADLWWSAADWDYYDDEWLAADVAEAWERALTAEACRGSSRQWERTFRRYLAMLVRVCRRARATLHTGGVTDPDFVVLLLDTEYQETLVRRVLPVARCAGTSPSSKSGQPRWRGSTPFRRPSESPTTLREWGSSPDRSAARRLSQRCVSWARRRFPRCCPCSPSPIRRRGPPGCWPTTANPTTMSTVSWKPR
ncbi:DUF4303 domain-containing protein [Micromonospora echinaurantiaca]|uniref:DUF4303 domain-containing protein n=1 Tax=Micromonospora echinaurantiaca TaxID=47857 RepID=UPI00341D86F5